MKLFDSILSLPKALMQFWGAGIEMKIQVLILLGVLYLLGFYSAKFLQSKVWWKWIIVLLFFSQALIQIYGSNNIIFIGPVIIGALRGFFKDTYGFAPKEWFLDFFYWIRSLRGESRLQHQAQAKLQEADEALRRSKEYEAKAKKSYQQQEAERKAYEKKLKDEMRHRRGYRSKPHEGASEEPPKREEKETRQEAPASSKTQPRELNPSIRADAFEILGVEQGASLEECKKAYRLLMGLYHPDKVAQLSGRRRTQAEEETKLINAAWMTIKN